MQTVFVLLFGLAVGWFGSHFYTKHQSGGESAEDLITQKADLEASVETKDGEIAGLQTRLLKAETELGEVRKTLNEASAAGAASKGEAGALKEELEALKREFRDYKEEYKISLRGKTVPLFEVGLRKFENAKILSVDNEHVSIEHSGGKGRYEIRELSPELQKFFAYEGN